MTNSGTAPAGNIVVWTETVALPNMGGLITQLGKAVPGYCPKPPDGTIQFVHPVQTLFPTETDWDSRAISLRKKDIETATGETKRFMVAVMGCVTYTFYLSSIQHSTGFMYLVGDSEKDPMSLYPSMSLDGEIIPKEDVRIVKVNAGTYAD
jgi:hypothetical protein